MKNLINLMILASVNKCDKYGLQIIKDIKAVTQLNFDLKLPSLYNSIKRMEGYGYLKSYWENSEIGGKRRYCSLTDKGRDFINSQMAYLDEAEKQKVNFLMFPELLPPNNNNAIKQQNMQNELAIQPNFFNQCAVNNSVESTQNDLPNSDSLAQDEEKRCDETLENQICILDPNERITDPNELKEKLNFKDIFGDMVYEKKTEPTISHNNNETHGMDAVILQQHETLERPSVIPKPQKNSQSSIDATIITDKHAIDDNYKLNVTLKSENRPNKQPTLIENQHIDFFQKKESNFYEEDEYQEDKSALDECLDYLYDIGINYAVYDNANFESGFAYDGSKYYKNKFRACKNFLSIFITSLVILSTYMVLDMHNFILSYQNYIFIGLCVLLFADAVYCLIKLVNAPKLLTYYEKRQKKQLLLPLCIGTILFLVVLAICFFCGMTISNFQYYLTYILMPILLLFIRYLNIFIEYSMVKNERFFINNE